MNSIVLTLLDHQWHLVSSSDQPYDKNLASIWPMKRWPEIRESVTRQSHLALWLDSDEEPESVADDLDRFSFVALHFPVFNDGRPYSSAAVLRQQLGFDKPLLAFGDVRKDQLEQMGRCGIDYYLLQDGQLLHRNDVPQFSYHYQSSTDKTKPLYATEHLD